MASGFFDHETDPAELNVTGNGRGQFDCVGHSMYRASVDLGQGEEVRMDFVE